MTQAFQFSSFLASDVAANWLAHALMASLHSSAMIPDQDAMAFFDDLTDEVSGAGYSAGGVALTTPTKVQTANVWVLGCDPITFSAITVPDFQYVLLYDFQTGVAATSPLIGWVDLGSAQSRVAADFVLTIPSSGIVQLAAQNAPGFP